MSDSMKRNPPVNQALTTIPITPLPRPRVIDQYLKPIFITSPTPKVLGQNFLDALPVEILLSIADFLPLEDIYCLSLCNHRLLAIFRNRTKHQHLERKVRLSFLHRLEHDHPHYYVCDSCLSLHDFSNISEPLTLPPSLRYSYPPRIDCLPYIGSCTFYTKSPSHYALHFSHLQLAMRRFYCGPEYGISTDALSYTEVTCHYVPGDRVASPTKLSSFDAQISPNPPSLILRFQHIMSMRSIASTVHDEDYDDVDQAYFALFQICKHTLETFWMQCITRNSYRSKCSRCEYCNIDYDVQIFENRPDDHVTAVVTSWINLGSGLSSDDPRWKFHTFDCVWGKEEEEEEEEAFRKDSSPRFAFETITDIPLRDLTSRNLSYLKDKRYQSVMAPIHGSVPAFWALWNGAAMPSSLVAY